MSGYTRRFSPGQKDLDVLHWQRFAAVGDIPRGQAKAAMCGDLSIAVFNVNGTYYATSNICPHAAGPLCEGWVEDDYVVCPWHGWSFTLSPEDAPRDGLPRYRTKVEDGAIYVEIPQRTDAHQS